jgi:hypothetical protein
MTITHVDSNHLADLEQTVATLTVRCAALELELAATKVVCGLAEQELALTTDRLTERSFELERLRTESEYRLQRLQRGEVRTGERRDRATYGRNLGRRRGDRRQP